ncbi:phage antirepressor KilAC domain-containing protein [Streptomyces sp. V2I9]|uniref:phage antirepressor KilAC domain-containing protein n=1 Tax=Streptomyces sp. V2I9 TaxID=3042304 RepID=UPI00277FF165|nr:phage antirepressor KilAC domain-containing protein [Streptomyces sp. V2I9]MDQ0985417.1 DNA-damage-inducible protein D [Streptomyces sp. V2I9]
MLLDHRGEERWSARDLQQLAGYSKWQEFEKVIAKAKLAILDSGMEPLDHFTGARKVISGGRWGRQEVDDYRLTRFGAYQVALNGDSSKPQIAAAKTYFAFKTREAELAAKPDVGSPEGVLALAEQYVAAAKELVATKRELSIAAPKAGKWDAFLNAEGLCGMTELADPLHTNVRTLTGWLVDIDVYRKQTSRYGGGRNMPRKSYQDAGQFVVKQETKNGFNFPTAYATARGIDLVVDLWEQRPAA